MKELATILELLTINRTLFVLLVLVFLKFAVKGFGLHNDVTMTIPCVLLHVAITLFSVALQGIKRTTRSEKRRTSKHACWRSS